MNVPIPINSKGAKVAESVLKRRMWDDENNDVAHKNRSLMDLTA
jgi:hypothetical protein